MTPIADMVRLMLEKGVAHEAIVMAVEGAELALLSAPVRGLSVDESADRRREKDRIRKQIERENLRKSADVRGNPQMSENASLSKESKKEEIKEEKEAKQRSVRGHRLPVEWRPIADDRQEALAKLGSTPAVEQEILKFHDYWKAQPGQRGVKLDWDATWRNWIRNAKGPQNERRKTVHDAARELHENFVNEYINPFDKPAPSGLCDGEGADVVRLLPARGRE